jgi:NADH-quinone oxidoreductase subunit J
MDTLASAVLFYLFAGVIAASAIGVVCSRNVVRTAVLLLITLIGVAGIFFLLDAEFLAAVQLVVYAGATMIILIFGVMLTSKSPFTRYEPKRLEVAIGATIGLVMLASLTAAILNLPNIPSPTEATQPYPVAQLGTALLGDYLLPFELSSVLLLLTMVGAAYLSKSRKRPLNPEP